MQSRSVLLISNSFGVAKGLCLNSNLAGMAGGNSEEILRVRLPKIRQHCYNLGQNEWNISTTPPPISMMLKWRVLVFARLHHCFGGGGGGGG